MEPTTEVIETTVQIINVNLNLDETNYLLTFNNVMLVVLFGAVVACTIGIMLQQWFRRV